MTKEVYVSTQGCLALVVTFTCRHDYNFPFSQILLSNVQTMDKIDIAMEIYLLDASPNKTRIYIIGVNFNRPATYNQSSTSSTNAKSEIAKNSGKSF